MKSFRKRCGHAIPPAANNQLSKGKWRPDGLFNLDCGNYPQSRCRNLARLGGGRAICVLAVLRYAGLLKSPILVVLVLLIAVPAIATTTDWSGPGEYFAKLPISIIGLAAVALITAAWFKQTRF